MMCWILEMDDSGEHFRFCDIRENQKEQAIVCMSRMVVGWVFDEYRQ